MKRMKHYLELLLAAELGSVLIILSVLAYPLSIILSLALSGIVIAGAFQILKRKKVRRDDCDLSFLTDITLVSCVLFVQWYEPLPYNLHWLGALLAITDLTLLSLSGLRITFSLSPTPKSRREALANGLTRAEVVLLVVLIFAACLTWREYITQPLVVFITLLLTVFAVLTFFMNLTPAIRDELSFRYETDLFAVYLFYVIYEDYNAVWKYHKFLLLLIVAIISIDFVRYYVENKRSIFNLGMIS